MTSRCANQWKHRAAELAGSRGHARLPENSSLTHSDSRRAAPSLDVSPSHAVELEQQTRIAGRCIDIPIIFTGDSDVPMTVQAVKAAPATF
jgi:FixJ family two-component response regulator